jgi:hypothetical protein
MKRSLKSARLCDEQLAGLYEKLAGREKELQARLDEIVAGLLDGSLNRALQCGPIQDYDVCCVPLIDRYVLVFRPDVSEPCGFDAARVRNVLDFSKATHFELLNVEE